MPEPRLLLVVFFVAFLVASLTIDSFVSWSPLTRARFRGAVLVIAIIWVLVLAGVVAWRGF